MGVGGLGVKAIPRTASAVKNLLKIGLPVTIHLRERLFLYYWVFLFMAKFNMPWLQLKFIQLKEQKFLGKLCRFVYYLFQILLEGGNKR